jgi:CubicO group peptidase (beta-lactamase class C family)
MLSKMIFAAFVILICYLYDTTATFGNLNMIARTKHRSGLLTLAVLLSPAAAFANYNLRNSIDAVFSVFGEDEPGCAVGVIHKGEFIHKAGYGLANMEYGIPISSQTVFRTGSVGKQFTAMAIAILAERGDLDLDADVHTYLPDLMDYGHKVTVRQMVHHFAGMGDYEHEAFRKADGTEFRFGNEDFATIEEFYHMVLKADLLHEPETTWLYSNLGYFLLSYVVESVSGKSLREFGEEEIFGPLEMTATHFNDNVNQVVINRADGYQRMADGSWEIFMTNLSWVGDGGVLTTIDDFIKWDQNFYDNKLGSGEASLIEMVETPLPDMLEDTEDGPQPVHYAFGLEQREQFGEYSIGHGGSWVGFTARYNRFPQLDMSVVVFCNSLSRSAYKFGKSVNELAVVAVRD